MQAIVTRWLAPTNYRPSRIKASAAAGSLTVPWDHSIGVDGNHLAAARALAERQGWAGRWIGGGMPSGDGDVFVCVDRADGEFQIDVKGE